MSEYEDVEFNLYTDAGNVERLYTARQESGRAYDAYFAQWLTNHNDGLASCAYAVNYMSYVEDLTSGYLANLDEEKEDILKHCSNVPTMESFDVSKVRGSRCVSDSPSPSHAPNSSFGFFFSNSLLE